MLCIALLFCSCDAQRRVLYLQDAASGTEVELPENYMIRIKPLDQMTIVVNSENPELAAPFNSSTNLNSLIGTLSPASTTNNSLQVITVSEEGTITLPVIGEIYCQGMTRQELSRNIEQRIIDGGYLTNPIVNVQFTQLSCSIVGEVKNPGRYDIDRDQLTIFEALAMAGDMTIYGNRTNVAVVREIDGRSIITRLDLRSEDVFHSPCFYIEQNDVIIVSPNKSRAATAEINQNRSFWISLASTGISLATLLLTILSK